MKGSPLEGVGETKMAVLKTLAGLSLIVAIIGQVAQGRRVKVVKETVFEVEEDNFGRDSPKAVFSQLQQTVQSSTICKNIFGYQVCATGAQISGGFSVIITVQGQTVIKVDVTNPDPQPYCQEIPGYGKVCMQLYNVDLANLSACVKLSAMGHTVDLGCFHVSN